MRAPSIKTLSSIFGDKAKEAKELLTMSRLNLLETPEGERRDKECYHSPSTADLRLSCLNELGNFHGVEGFSTKKGLCLYLNAGDTYTPTLVLFQGRYKVSCWGDIAEKFSSSKE